MKSIIGLATVLVSVCILAGCDLSQPAILGHRPDNGAVAKIASIKASLTPQTIEGTMIDKCPIAGCWFHVKDQTGVIKVDTKNAGFVVAQVPINAHVVVTGIVKPDDTSTLAASGMTYR